MKNTFTIGNSIASIFMIVIGVNLLFIHQKSDFLPKYVTIILGILILFISIGGILTRIKNFKKDIPKN
jgi:type IV secretory pathway VirB2 component (pilin)